MSWILANHPYLLQQWGVLQQIWEFLYLFVLSLNVLCIPSSINTSKPRRIRILGLLSLIRQLLLWNELFVMRRLHSIHRSLTSQTIKFGLRKRGYLQSRLTPRLICLEWSKKSKISRFHIRFVSASCWTHTRRGVYGFVWLLQEFRTNAQGQAPDKQGTSSLEELHIWLVAWSTNARTCGWNCTAIWKRHYW